MPVWRCSWLYQWVNSSMNFLDSVSDPKRSGNSGPYFRVLNSASEYGLSFETRGLEYDRVTSRSASRAATVLLVIDVPRSACTTCGTPWTEKICSISSFARTPDSWAWTWTPTMYRE